MPTPKTTVRKIEPGMNIHIDRLLAIYPDPDNDIFKIGDKIVIKPKEATEDE
jgi:hypothetical protein